ncbi:MAG TPA: hypothetical protein VN228_16590, partial [Pyrinomonadaceae bacterium]|nr:hypothetical protein [Pyrinomonadaceae bacterium]
RAGRPATHYAEAATRLRAFTPEDVTRAARALLDPELLVWVIAGERAAVERELREAGVTGARVFDPAETRDR